MSIFIFFVQPTQMNLVTWMRFLFYKRILLFMLIFVNSFFNAWIRRFFRELFIEKLMCIICCKHVVTFFLLALFNLVFILDLYIHNIGLYLITIKSSMTGGTSLVINSVNSSKSSLIIFPWKYFVHRFLGLMVTILLFIPSMY